MRMIDVGWYSEAYAVNMSMPLQQGDARRCQIITAAASRRRLRYIGGFATRTTEPP
jgi:hypothetical protein